jgi:predicted ATPase
MSQDCITQLRISGLRVIDHIELDLRGLTVLIGGNGTGKTTILDALDIIGHAARKTPSIDGAMKIHGRAQSLLRQGRDQIGLGVTIEGDGPRIDYDFAVACLGGSVVVVDESIDVHKDKKPVRVMLREKRNDHVVDLSLFDALNGKKISIPPNALALPEIRRVSLETERLAQALDRIDSGHECGWPYTIKEKTHPHEETLTFPRAFQKLREQGKDTWQKVLEKARLGLSADLKDLVLKPSGASDIELEAVFGSLSGKSLPVSMMSDGQRSYLAFVALSALHETPAGSTLLTAGPAGSTTPSILSFDDPEVNLHPALQSRVVWMLEEMAKKAPMLIATHSNRFLDALSDPAASIVLCELDKNQTTRIWRPDPVGLDSWLEEYQGMGSIRAAGYESYVFGKDDVPCQPVKKP